MSSAGLRRFQGHPVFGDLTPLGIEVRQRAERAPVETIDGRLWKQLGSIYVYSTAQIIVDHYEDTTPFEVALLNGQAEDVWRGVTKPTKARFWTLHRRDGRPDVWSTKIFGPADVLRDEAVAVIEAENIARAAAQTRDRHH